MDVHRHSPLIGQPRQAANVIEMAVRQENRARRPGAEQPAGGFANVRRCPEHPGVYQNPPCRAVDEIHVRDERAEATHAVADLLDGIDDIHALVRCNEYSRRKRDQRLSARLPGCR